jgi:DNA (cytosine-5)-methyltransferase 1
MKILNLYAGIGGNRKLWGGEHEITAVENNKEIANIYHDFFPDDEIIIADAHQYLLEHYKEYDFIWSSPPCQSHSVCNNFLNAQGIIRYPAMELWQEIIFLNKFSICKYVIENVKPYYKVFIEPSIELGRHFFWSNFFIEYKKFNYTQIGTLNKKSKIKVNRQYIIREAQIPELSILNGFNLNEIKISNKSQILRNCVNPDLGLYILNQALNKKMPNEKTLFD